MYLPKQNGKTLSRMLEIVLLFSFLCPFSLTYNFAAISRVMSLLRVVGIAYALLLFLLAVRFKRADKNMLFFLAFEAMLILSTLINGGSIGASTSEAIKFIAIFTICYTRMLTGDELIFKWLSAILWLMVFVNFVTLLLYPGGMYITYNTGWSSNMCWFLGDKNGIINYLIPSVLLSALNYMNSDRKRKKRFTFLFQIVISIYTVIAIQSSTTIVVFAVFLLGIIFPDMLKMHKVFNARNYMFAVIGVLCVVVFFNFIHLFDFLIVDILHKEATLTNRTLIWGRALLAIKENFLFGVGYQDTMAVRSILLQVNTHNHYLWILFRTGIIGMVFFVLNTLNATKELMKYKNDARCQLIAWTFFCFFIEWMFEVCTNYTLPFMFAMCFSIDAITKKWRKNEDSSVNTDQIELSETAS